MIAPHRTAPASCLLVVLACALPFASSGCSQRACFFWTEAEGACPSQAEAIDFFTNSSCDSPIESVDSEPEFDGELCCYDVTERVTDEVLCTSPPDVPPPPMTGGSGGGMPMCQTCSSFATAAFMGTAPSGLCPSSQAIFDALTLCLCSGACQGVCTNDLICMGSSSTTLCFDCATDSAVGCGSQFSACVNDL